jgi:hypothetical protein
MAFLFSPKLIERTILVFREENGIELSQEQANEYLYDLGGLFLAFADRKTPDNALCVSGVSVAKPDIVEYKSVS